MSGSEDIEPPQARRQRAVNQQIEARKRERARRVRNKRALRAAAAKAGRR